MANTKPATKAALKAIATAAANRGRKIGSQQNTRGKAEAARARIDGKVKG